MNESESCSRLRRLDRQIQPAGMRRFDKWLATVARFSDYNLHVAHRASEVWSSIRNTDNTLNNDPEHKYRLYRDRIIDEFVEFKTAKVTP
jgi:hypothetical protein